MELKPCPFCGGNGRIAGDERLYYVTCMSVHCYASIGEIYDRDAMPDHAFSASEDAAAAWNHRVPLETTSGEGK